MNGKEINNIIRGLIRLKGKEFVTGLDLILDDNESYTVCPDLKNKLELIPLPPPPRPSRKRNNNNNHEGRRTSRRIDNLPPTRSFKDCATLSVVIEDREYRSRGKPSPMPLFDEEEVEVETVTVDPNNEKKRRRSPNRKLQDQIMEVRKARGYRLGITGLGLRKKNLRTQALLCYVCSVCADKCDILGMIDDDNYITNNSDFKSKVKATIEMLILSVENKFDIDMNDIDTTNIIYNYTKVDDDDVDDEKEEFDPFLALASVMDKRTNVSGFTELKKAFEKVLSPEN